jgi:hypothetical protein
LTDTIGSPVDEWGTLVREDGAFALRRDLGGRYELRLHRVPVDHVAKRVRVRGTLMAGGVVDVDGVSAV